MCSVKKDVHKNFAIFAEKKLVLESLFDKGEGLRSATLSKETPP